MIYVNNYKYTYNHYWCSETFLLYIHFKSIVQHADTSLKEVARKRMKTNLGVLYPYQASFSYKYIGLKDGRGIFRWLTVTYCVPEQFYDILESREARHMNHIFLIGVRGNGL